MSELITFLKEIYEASKERLKNPISRNFIISFLLFNWKAILVLIYSNECIEDRIAFIKSNYANEWCILAPLGFAVIYTLAIDFIMWAFDAVLLKSKKGRKDVANSYKLHILKKETSIVKAQLELEDAKSRSQELYDLNQQIENLKNEIILKNDALNKSQSEKNNLLKELNNFNENFKRKHYLNDEKLDVISIESILKSLNSNQKKALVDLFKGYETNYSLKDLSNFIDKGLIFQDFNGSRLTDLGRIIAKYQIENEK